MKKLFLLCGALLLMSAAVAQAAQLNIAWTNCTSDGGTADKTSACTSNSGSQTLVVSFVAPSGGIGQMSGAEAFLYLATSNGGAALPKWWDSFNSGTCRTSAITGNVVLPGTANNCLDAWSGIGVGGLIGYNENANGPGSVVVDMAAAVPSTSLQTIDDTDEYFLFNLKIANTGTAGTACPGCLTPACILFHELDVTQPVGVGDFHLSTTGAHTFATWQGGAIGAPGCPAATPTNNKSWGALKTLYR